MDEDKKLETETTETDSKKKEAAPEKVTVLEVEKEPVKEPAKEPEPEVKTVAVPKKRRSLLATALGLVNRD